MCPFIFYYILEIEENMDIQDPYKKTQFNTLEYRRKVSLRVSKVKPVIISIIWSDFNDNCKS